MLLSSIRAKLTVWYVAVLAVFILGFAVAIYYSVIQSLNRDINSRLVSVANSYSTAAQAEQDEEGRDLQGERAVLEAISEFRFRDYGLIIKTVDGRLVGKSDAAPSDLTAFAENEAISEISFGNQLTRIYREDFEVSSRRYKLYVTYSLKDFEEMRARLGIIFLVGVLATLLLAGIVGYLLAKKSLAPVSEIGQQAAAIGEANLGTRLHVKNEQDELGQLAGVINSLLDRLSAAFEQQRRFMADASHELRTPLAIVRGESEVSLSRRDRTPAEYMESLTVVNEESVRLSQIVEDLFTLARADSGQIRPAMEAVDIDEIVSDAVRSMKVIADAKDITIELLTNEPAQIRGNDALLYRLFVNILHNAIKFSPRESGVIVSSLPKESSVLVTIRDRGCGIPIEHRANIYKRFYRVDKARGREAADGMSGAGLGLSIAEWIANLHDARIELSESGPGGSTFTLTFPVNVR